MLADFLYSTGSLTKKLEMLGKRPLGVQICHQGYDMLTPKQQRYFEHHAKALHRPLPNTKQKIAWQRSVYLYGNDKHPWVLAHSYYPIAALKGEARRLPHLGTTPIGYILFKKQHTLPYTRTFESQEGQPARQTLYDWQGRLLLIEEIFLPALIERLDATHF